MAVYYIDLDNGSDSNNGTTWALAWKTISLGATAARIAAGDEIRVSKTPNPVSIGNATWTNLSKTVTLATAQTQTIDLCNTTAYTASANITSTASTTRKEGSHSCSLAVAAGFTTGKMAYKTLTTIDLSSYQRISFWFRNTVAVASATVLKVCLCSDTTGDTIVDTFWIPTTPSTNRFMPISLVKDGGGNLGSSIQSIAIYANTDPGTPTLLFDDFIACTTSGLCLQNLISKNGSSQGGTEGYYGIQSINGTTILLDNDTETSAASGRGYYGATETVETYIRSTFKTAIAAAATTVVSELMDSGTAANPILYKFGYEVGTTNQNGETFLDGLNGNGYGFNIASKNYNSVNWLSVVRYNWGVYFSGTSNNNTFITISNANNNANYGVYLASGPYQNTFNTIVNANNNGTVGIYVNTSNNNVISLISNNNNNLTDGIYFNNSHSNLISQISNTNNNGTYSVDFAISFFNKLPLISNANNNNSYGVYFDRSSNNYIRVVSSTGGTGFYSNAGVNFFNNSTFLQGTEFASVATPVNNWVWSLNHDDSYGNNWGFTYQATVNLQTSIVHGTEPCSWKTAITGSTRNTTYPVKLKIAEVAFSASSLVTVKAWVKKDHATNVGCKLVCYANTSVGINSDVSTTKTSDTNWEELTITFTPTQAGATEIYLESWYSAGNSNTYVGTINVSQA